MDEDIHSCADLRSAEEKLKDPELLLDVLKGLSDIGVGRVVSHEEARVQLIARYSD